LPGGKKIRGSTESSSIYGCHKVPSGIFSIIFFALRETDLGIGSRIYPTGFNELLLIFLFGGGSPIGFLDFLGDFIGGFFGGGSSLSAGLAVAKLSEIGSCNVSVLLQSEYLGISTVIAFSEI